MVEGSDGKRNMTGRELVTVEHGWWVHPGLLYYSSLSCMFHTFHIKKCFKAKKKKIRKLFTSESHI